MGAKEVRQTWERLHRGPEETFYTNGIDHGLPYNPRKKGALLNYVPLEEWNRLKQDRQKKNWYRTMAELCIYSQQDIEALEGHNFEEDYEVRNAITWMLLYIIILSFLNAFGVSSVFELFF